MLVSDWIPASKGWSSDQKLKAYKVTTALYGSLAAFLAWSLNFGSYCSFLLLGFAMVVPPAMLSPMSSTGTYDRTCSVLGNSYRLRWWCIDVVLQPQLAGIENAEAGGFAQYWFEVCQFLGEWRDPSFLTLLLPLVVILS